MGTRATRIVPSTRPGEPYYVLLLLPRHTAISDEEYRLIRERMLENCCIITKLIYPDAQDIVGIATETSGTDEHSEDFLHFDGRDWSEQSRDEARRLQEETGLLTNITVHKGTAYEYPVVEQLRHTKTMTGPNPRNKLCPCGSGKKYKKCCLK
jgi:hypothetical protein